MPLSMSATATERLPVVVAQAVGAEIFDISYCWPNDGSLGMICPARLIGVRPDTESTVRASSSSTKRRARYGRRERTRELRRTQRSGDSRMGRFLITRPERVFLL